MTGLVAATATYDGIDALLAAARSRLSRIEAAAAYDARVIVLCQEGFTSSLAADVLCSIGITRATELVGGFAAWRAAGLPVAGTGIA